MAYATGMTLASRSILPLCSRTFVSPLRVASLLVCPEKSSSAFFRRVQVHHFFSSYTTPLFSSVKCSFQSSSSLETETQAVSRPNVIDILEERGLLESVTSENLRSACSDPSLPPLKVYCGFDPTAESLHLGNLLGLFESKSAARRMLKQGGIYINNERVDEDKRVEEEDIVEGKGLFLSAGKKNKVVVRIF